MNKEFKTKVDYWTEKLSAAVEDEQKLAKFKAELHKHDCLLFNQQPSWGKINVDQSYEFGFKVTQALRKRFGITSLPVVELLARGHANRYIRAAVVYRLAEWPYPQVAELLTGVIDTDPEGLVREYAEKSLHVIEYKMVRKRLARG